MTACYSNENFPLPAVDELRRLGHDVLTIQETGRANSALPDEEVLAFASAEGRVLLTLNRKHFIRLHQATPRHTGIVVCTFDPDFTALARRIHDALTEQPDVAGQLLRVNRPATP
jgi:hypothetical protein